MALNLALPTLRSCVDPIVDINYFSAALEVPGTKLSAFTLLFSSLLEGIIRSSVITTY
jgi:hypothetical protein